MGSFPCFYDWVWSKRNKFSLPFSCPCDCTGIFTFSPFLRALGVSAPFKLPVLLKKKNVSFSLQLRLSFLTPTPPTAVNLLNVNGSLLHQSLNKLSNNLRQVNFKYLK